LYTILYCSIVLARHRTSLSGPNTTVTSCLPLGPQIQAPARKPAVLMLFHACANSLEANSGERFLHPPSFPINYLHPLPYHWTLYSCLISQCNSPARASDVSLSRFLDHTPGKTEQPVAKATTYTTHKRGTRTSMPSAGIEPPTPAINCRKQTS
jgi:hypothetical protein